MPVKKKTDQKKQRTFAPKKGKTWTDKVNDASKSFKIEKLDKNFSDMSAGDKMLIATPKIIDEYISNIPSGRSVNLLTMRKDLANEYGADNTCPLTTGIFLRIASEAALEQLSTGKSISQVTPFWRVIDEKMPVAKKLSCGVDFIKKQRAKEKISKE